MLVLYSECLVLKEEVTRGCYESTRAMPATRSDPVSTTEGCIAGVRESDVQEQDAAG